MIDDCAKILHLDTSFAKAYYRMAQAQFALGKHAECIETCRKGLEKTQEETLKKVMAAAQEGLERETAKQKSAASALSARNEELRAALESKKVSYSRDFSTDLSRQFKPTFRVTDGQLTTSIVVYYPEFQQMDFIETAGENESLWDHVGCVLEGGLPWDLQRHYLDLHKVKVYLMLQKREVFCGSQCVLEHPALAEVSPEASVLTALQTPNYVVPGCLEVFVVSVQSPFHQHFLATHK